MKSDRNPLADAESELRNGDSGLRNTGIVATDSK
jgi:hypothetical protein